MSVGSWSQAAVTLFLMLSRKFVVCAPGSIIDTCMLYGRNSTLQHTQLRLNHFISNYNQRFSCHREAAQCSKSLEEILQSHARSLSLSENYTAEYGKCKFLLVFHFHLRPPSATVVSAEPFSHGTGTLRCLQKEMATYRH